MKRQARSNPRRLKSEKSLRPLNPNALFWIATEQWAPEGSRRWFLPPRPVSEAPWRKAQPFAREPWIVLVASSQAEAEYIADAFSVAYESGELWARNYQAALGSWIDRYHKQNPRRPIDTREAPFLKAPEAVLQNARRYATLRAATPRTNPVLTIGPLGVDDIPLMTEQQKRIARELMKRNLISQMAHSGLIGPAAGTVYIRYSDYLVTVDMTIERDGLITTNFARALALDAARPSGASPGISRETRDAKKAISAFVRLVKTRGERDVRWVLGPRANPTLVYEPMNQNVLDLLSPAKRAFAKSLIATGAVHSIESNQRGEVHLAYIDRFANVILTMLPNTTIEINAWRMPDLEQATARATGRQRAIRYTTSDHKRAKRLYLGLVRKNAERAVQWMSGEQASKRWQEPK